MTFGGINKMIVRVSLHDICVEKNVLLTQSSKCFQRNRNLYSTNRITFETELQFVDTLTSNPLFIMVAESRVILAPISQLG